MQSKSGVVQSSQVDVSEVARPPDFEFFIPQHPRVGGFSGRERRRKERYLRPVIDLVDRPIARQHRLRVEYRFVFVHPDFDLSGRRRILRTDVDNLLKFVNDLLTGVAWEDDSQIFELLAVKEHGAESAIGVRIWLLAEDSPG